MKRSGAWWVKETGNEMLGIRCAIYKAQSPGKCPEPAEWAQHNETQGSGGRVNAMVV